jgi:hypothetical protein
VAKATKRKKSEEGRHVGLHCYDLLIEALKTLSERNRDLSSIDITAVRLKIEQNQLVRVPE